MKTYNALFNSIDEIKLILSTAGIVDGVTLTPEQLKTTRKVLFWYISVRSTDASKKDTYVTFDVLEITPRVHGNGKPIAYRVTINLQIFTNKEDIRNLIKEINDAAEDNGWSFDLASNPDYEQTSRVFTYSFNLGKWIAHGD